MELIRTPAFLTHNNIDGVIKQVTREYLRRNRKIKFDLQKTSYISLDAMIMLMLFCWQLKLDEGKDIFMNLSRGSKLRSCMHILSRLGFFSHMPDSTKYYPYKPSKGQNKIGSNHEILEITRIDKDVDPLLIVDSARAAIEANTGYELNQILDICKMISEFMQNIIDHSESAIPGFIAIQNYPQRHYMQLVIADAGLGIPYTIRHSNEETFTKLDDIEAIRESLKLGVSRHGKDAGRGEGLTECVNLSKKHLAKLHIRSSIGEVEIDTRKNLIREEIVEKVRGTQIFLSFPTQ